MEPKPVKRNNIWKDAARRPWLLMMIIITTPLIVFSLVSWYQLKYTNLPVLGPADHKIADFNMKDQFGRAQSLKDWDDQIVVVDFFFTHCPVVCPKMTRNLKSVQQQFLSDPEVRFASFSVDPERDSVAQLKDYAERMDIRGNWQLLTGDKTEIYRLARKSFMVVTTEGDGGPNDFIHSDYLILLDKEKRIRGYYKGTESESVESLVRDINKLKRRG